jgi:uncharacterized protein YecE (DUF72 family)
MRSEDEQESVEVRRERAGRYDFRSIHPAARFGTASDRYGGWIGQIYPESYRSSLSSSNKRLKGETYVEEKVPVEAIADYFQHFECLEIDFTFYSVLRNPDGQYLWPFHQLARYAELSPENAQFVLKAPQSFFARRLRASGGGRVRYDDNPSFLEADAYVTQFLEPAVEVLGGKLAGIAFQQEYQRVADSPPSEQNIRELDAFFSRLPQGVQSHIELRSPHLLTSEFFSWLRSVGIGFVFSHWTYLPRLKRQWELCEGVFSAADGSALIRLLTPLNMPYADAYALAHPFDAPVAELADLDQTKDMIDDTAALIYRAADDDVVANIFTNNRAYGNAPSLAQAVAYRVLAEEARRARIGS